MISSALIGQLHESFLQKNSAITVTPDYLKRFSAAGAGALTSMMSVLIQSEQAVTQAPRGGYYDTVKRGQ